MARWFVPPVVVPLGLFVCIGALVLYRYLVGL
jgi:hypothetical protein